MEEKQRKKLHPLVLLVLVLLLLMVVLCSVVLGLWLHGRSAMNQETQAPSLPQQPSASLPEIPEEPEEEEPQGDFVEYNGVRYRYNDQMRNFLLMGIDSDETPDAAAGSHDQADVLVLAALDMTAGEMTLININRDTICMMEQIYPDGTIHLEETQLALAYAYGDGRYKSCELTRDAVSNIFYGLPIHGYAAYYMKGIGPLNDAVGGVTVKILGDYPFHQIGGVYDMMREGRTLTLNSDQAIAYIRARLEEQADANELRMKRQKQYMLALIQKAKEQVLSNPASVLTLYNAVDEYVLTDLNLGQISYMATRAATMDFSGDLRTLTTERKVGEDHLVEQYVDQTALYELMLDVFYTPVAEGETN